MTQRAEIYEVNCFILILDLAYPFFYYTNYMVNYEPQGDIFNMELKLKQTTFPQFIRRILF